MILLLVRRCFPAAHLLGDIDPNVRAARSAPASAPPASYLPCPDRKWDSAVPRLLLTKALYRLDVG